MPPASSSRAQPPCLLDCLCIFHVFLLNYVSNTSVYLPVISVCVCVCFPPQLEDCSFLKQILSCCASCFKNCLSCISPNNIHWRSSKVSSNKPSLFYFLVPGTPRRKPSPGFESQHQHLTSCVWCGQIASLRRDFLPCEVESAGVADPTGSWRAGCQVM